MEASSDDEDIIKVPKPAVVTPASSPAKRRRAAADGAADHAAAGKAARLPGQEALDERDDESQHSASGAEADLNVHDVR